VVEEKNPGSGGYVIIFMQYVSPLIQVLSISGMDQWRYGGSFLHKPGRETSGLGNAIGGDFPV
jgi:hypothetical protein